MTVLELAIFLAVYRAERPLRFADVVETITAGFECAVPRKVLSRAILKMGARGWLIADGDKLLPAEAGRRAACLLVRGIIQLLDQGTRLIDVALMLAMLKLTREELEHGNLDN
ncbi:hypothetical protein [Sphingomonas sp. KC8]|uniref:hypothetical protein n=1 Tax=Sphingomonas sp. KC8 TaxID=1030157 RepID=UPI00049737B2|nr:hypothetical protein [Sphingomonas sp. KC8]